jgi:legumain
MVKLLVVWVFAALCCCLNAKSLNDIVDDEAKKGVHWAVLVAGSNGWYNYRHQADACHAYQILRRNGIPEERIITMMYDDLANNAENPTPGVIINHPNGTDVYGGVKIDYSGEDVTPDNFLAVLQGQQDAVNGKGTGRVLQSGPNDRVFVNFADHGAPGIIAFPRDELHAKDLMDAVTNMHTQQKYKELVFYIEACESGSMFENLLPDDINVFATTAANGEESSYACYYDKERRTYLGDVYSVMWMEDSDAEDIRSETLQQQFNIVKKETNTSHVQEYGDMGIAKEPVANFQGGAKSESIRLPKVPLDAVPSEQVPMAILHHRLQDAKSMVEQELILQEIQALRVLHDNVVNTMDTIVKATSRDHRQADRIRTVRYTLTNHACYQPAVELFDERCFDISQNDYALRQLYKLVNLCEEQVQVEKILEAIADTCDHH